MYLEHVGECMVKNCKTGLVCVGDFKAAGWGNAGKHEVTAGVFRNQVDQKNGSKPLATIEGKWSESLTGKMSDGAEAELWKANEKPEKWDWQYMFTKFTMQLNHLPDEMKAVLPRSDSRLRPDQRALENHQNELAAEEKHRLEEKQRAARKWRAENPGNDFRPKYFKQVVDPDSNEGYYAYGVDGCRDYWRDRRLQDFDHMEDIF